MAWRPQFGNHGSSESFDLTDEETEAETEKMEIK